VTGRLVIALVCDAVYPYSHGGREFRYQELLPKLAEHVDIHVYTMRWWTGQKVFTENGVTFHAMAPLMPMYAKSGRRSIIQGIVFAIFSLRLLACHFDVLDVDQIPYFHLFPLRLIAIVRRKPLVATWHEVWGPSPWHQYLKWIGWLAWLVEAISFRLPDRIVAVSDQTSARLHKFLGTRASITTIPNGIDIEAIEEISASSSKVDIVTVGRLIEHKRVHILLEVISSLHARGIYATCRIIGDGPQRSALQQQAKMLGIDSAVEFCCDIAEQKELYSLIKASKLFVSLSAREGFGIAVLEAIACGVRVLTTTAPDNLAQYLAMRYSRGSVCGTSVADITEAVALALAQPGSDDRLSTDPWVAEYSWQTMVQRIVSIYRPETAIRPETTALPPNEVSASANLVRLVVGRCVFAPAAPASGTASPLTTTRRRLASFKYHGMLLDCGVTPGQGRFSKLSVPAVNHPSTLR
jgi:glycosyltransferase involved in cell wall biosynthesis